MKKGVNFLGFGVLITIIATILASFVYADLLCDVRNTACPEIDLFHISAQTNAHAGDCNAYSLKTCCRKND